MQQQRAGEQQVVCVVPMVRPVPTAGIMSDGPGVPLYAGCGILQRADRSAGRGSRYAAATLNCGGKRRGLLLFIVMQVHGYPGRRLVDFGDIIFGSLLLFNSNKRCVF